MKSHPTKLKLYLDTTIPSYVFAFDSPERMALTRQFMRVGQSQYQMLISDVVIREINRAVEPKRSQLLETVHGIEVLVASPLADKLAEAYIKEGALPRGSWEDAMHVAVATLAQVDAVVSWNFGHLVNIRRKKSIARINEKNHHRQIDIVTPEEVLSL
jgi:predicted nucleic acid-binding protein